MSNTPLTPIIIIYEGPAWQGRTDRARIARPVPGQTDWITSEEYDRICKEMDASNVYYAETLAEALEDLTLTEARHLVRMYRAQAEWFGAESLPPKR